MAGADAGAEARGERLDARLEAVRERTGLGGRPAPAEAGAARVAAHRARQLRVGPRPLGAVRLAGSPAPAVLGPHPPPGPPGQPPGQLPAGPGGGLAAPPEAPHT